MIQYDGKENFKKKVNRLIDKMANDNDFVYQLEISENVLNGRIKSLYIRTTDVRNSMPDF